MEICADNFVRFFVSVGKVARRLFFGQLLRKVGEGVNLFAVLNFKLGKIYRALIYPCGRSRFKTSDVEAELNQAVRKRVCGLKAVRSGGLLPFARDDASV